MTLIPQYHLDLLEGHQTPFDDRQNPKFLIKTLLRGPDITNSLQELIKVVWSPIRIFQTFIIYGKALHQILRKMLRGPAAELNSPDISNSVANG